MATHTNETLPLFPLTSIYTLTHDHYTCKAYTDCHYHTYHMKYTIIRYLQDKFLIATHSPTQTHLHTRHCTPVPLYNTRDLFVTHNVRTEHYGKSTLSYLGQKVWNIIPNEIKSAATLIVFKQKIRSWKPDKCPCKLCKTYIAGVGIID